jgi:CBS-domain-containing membrane protein
MRRVMSWLGLELTPNNHREKVISGVGGVVGILCVMVVTHWAAGPDAVMPVVASMGASAVLLFAAPHGPLSQPWAFGMGHLVSAVAGVACAMLIRDPMIAGPVAVGVAITSMYYARCIHPPGGATALTYVLAGPAVRKLGWGYVALPVGANVAVLLAAAVGFNWVFGWRRYPAAIAAAAAPHRKAKGRLSREDWAHALREVGSLADVTEEELAELYDLAVRHAADVHRARRATTAGAATPATPPPPPVREFQNA